MVARDPFNMLLYPIRWYFVEDFYISVRQRFWPVLFFLWVVLAWLHNQSNTGHFLLFRFSEEFEKDLHLQMCGRIYQ